MSTARFVTVAFALLVTACGAKGMRPPELVVDRTVCSHCAMFVSETTHAAAYQVPGESARVFDDIGCMLAAVRSEPASPIAIWVQDASGGGWLAAGDAVFVASPQIRTPMHGGVLAYADLAAAQNAATKYRGQIVRTFDELTAAKGDVK